MWQRKSGAAELPPLSLAQPLHQRTFRNIWLASLLSNLGQHIQSVAAAWVMVQLTSAADLVALVQTATFLPMVLFALPGGAIADIYNRRVLAIISLMISLAGAVGLTALAATHHATPIFILLFCFITGVGAALFFPAWQASVTDQVGPEAMPAAVVLTSLSSNASRVVGPAIGGIVVATAGAGWAFGLNVLLYLPLLFVLIAWAHRQPASLLPRENVFAAIAAGVRYMRYSVPVRRVLHRTLLVSFGQSGMYALAPLVARDILASGAMTYGVLLGGFGVGAVAIALVSTRIRGRWSSDTILTACNFATAAALVVLATSPWPAFSALATLAMGATWMLSMSLFNIGVQLSGPRWVTGRAVSLFQVMVAIGLSGGAYFWGYVAAQLDVSTALWAAGAYMLFAAFARIWAPMPFKELDHTPAPPPSEPQVTIEVGSRSGPIIVQVEYVVGEAKASDFYRLASEIQRIRARSGAFALSLSRDIADATRWIEQFRYSTWLDYLRARERSTRAEQEVLQKFTSFHDAKSPIRVIRMLQQPYE